MKRQKEIEKNMASIVYYACHVCMINLLVVTSSFWDGTLYRL